MPNRNEIYRMVIAQAVLRELDAEEVNGLVAIRYPSPQDERQDNLHKQSIRALVKKKAPDWKIHIASMGESGFTVEVRPAPGANQVPSAEPGPVTAGQEIDLDDASRIRELAQQLGGIAKELEALAS